jgi:hypothetical protein
MIREKCLRPLLSNSNEREPLGVLFVAPYKEKLLK